MTSPEVRVAWYAAALEELSLFLTSDEIVWPLERPPAQLRQDLSLGGLLLIQDSLRAEASLPAPTKQRLEELERRWATLSRSQASALARKAEKELRMRVNLWKAYLADLGERRGMTQEYQHQVRQRAMIERLADLGASQNLTGLDDQLRAVFRRGPFVWQTPLQSAYPESRYWFLYGAPETED
ncbi:MAG TPA: hypothetical protein VFI11_11005 [Anaerolineales bacterium]|nr:hypothetical protein [Anaerolineales bacterium]